MPNIVEENPTRKKILLFLKKNGGMTTDDLSKSLQITPMGVRQHLMALEKKGLVRYDAMRHGIGRPNFVYKLTDKADDFFPKNYNRFAVDILKHIERKEGREKVEEIFRWRKDRMLEDKRDKLNGGRPLADRLRAFTEMLQNDGYMVDLIDRGKDAFIVREFNCPIMAVSRDYPEACHYELELYRDLFGQGVERKQCLAQDGRSCEYVIPREVHAA